MLAGRVLPVLTFITLLRTTLANSIVIYYSLQIRRAVSKLRERKEFIIFLANYSQKKLTIILRRITAVTTPPLIYNQILKLTAIARISTIVIALATQVIRILITDAPLTSLSLFRLQSLRRRFALALSKLDQVSVFNSSTTC